MRVFVVAFGKFYGILSKFYTILPCLFGAKKHQPRRLVFFVDSVFLFGKDCLAVYVKVFDGSAGVDADFVKR